MSYRVPDRLIEQLTIPELVGPVYVETLLVHINELEGLVETANQRFNEIHVLQNK